MSTLRLARDLMIAALFCCTALLWWTPRLLMLKLRRHHRHQLPKQSSSKPTWYFRATENLRRRFIRHMRRELIAAVPRGARVLDVGAGSGELAAVLRDDRGADVTCLDVADCNREGFTTVMWDGGALPFADASFDVVVFSYVLHHSASPATLLAEACRVTRRAVLVCEDHAPIAREVWARVHAATYNDLYDIDGTVTYHSLERWRELFESHGLSVAQVSRRWNLDSFTLPLMVAFFELHADSVASRRLRAA